MPIKALVIHSYDNMSAVRANSDDEIETLKGRARLRLLQNWMLKTPLY